MNKRSRKNKIKNKIKTKTNLQNDGSICGVPLAAAPARPAQWWPVARPLLGPSGQRRLRANRRVHSPLSAGHLKGRCQVHVPVPTAAACSDTESSEQAPDQIRLRETKTASRAGDTFTRKEEVTLTTVYAPHGRLSLYVKQEVTELKGETGSLERRVRAFHPPLLK